jgi:NitT/TauT family transport system substrate-binding protein
MRHIYRALLASTAVAVIAAAGACSSSASKDTANGSSSQNSCQGATVKVAESSYNLIYLPVLVAKNAGYDKAGGFTLQIENITGSANVTAALVSGQADFAATASSTPIAAINGGAPIKMTTALQVKNGLQLIVKKSLADAHGLTSSSSLADIGKALAGQKIGVSDIGGGADALAQVILNAGGVNPKTGATIVAVGNHASQTASFTTGHVVAIIDSPPYTFTDASQGDGVIVFNPAHESIPGVADQLFSVVSAQNSTISKNPALIACFNTAIDKALALIHSDPQKVADLTQKEMGVTDTASFLQTLQDQASTFPTTATIQPADYANLVTFANLTGGTKISLSFSDAVYTGK